MVTFSEANASNAYEATKTLSQWHRLVESDGEIAAREWIATEFDQRGVEVEREQFVTSDYAINFVFRVISPLLGISLVVTYVVSYFQWLDDWLGVFAAFGVVLFSLSQSAIMERSFGKTAAVRFGKKFITENIVGKIDASEPHANVIFLCHYDTKSQRFPSYLRVLLFIGGTLWTLVDGIRLLIYQIFALFAASLANTFWDVAWWDVMFAFLLNFLLIFNNVGNDSPGALDNAAAVGILLELSRIFTQQPPQCVNLRFVATGSEELGLNGAAAFVKKHAPELNQANTYFIVYDSPSMRQVLWLLTSFGVPKKPICSEISEILLEIAREQGIPPKSLWLPIGAATDHLVVKQAGYKAGVITGPSPQVHTAKDTIDYIKVEGLQRAGIIGVEFVRKIASLFQQND
jgi:hypothetical protein